MSDLQFQFFFRIVQHVYQQTIITNNTQKHIENKAKKTSSSNNTHGTWLSKKFAHIRFLKWVFSSRDRCLSRIDVVKKFKWNCILVLLSLQTDNGFGCFMFHAISVHVLQSLRARVCACVCFTCLPSHFGSVFPSFCFTMIFRFVSIKMTMRKSRSFRCATLLNHFTRPRKWFFSAVLVVVVAISQEHHLLFTSHENFK